jgi:hypothetical protein
MASPEDFLPQESVIFAFGIERAKNADSLWHSLGETGVQ